MSLHNLSLFFRVKLSLRLLHLLDSFKNGFDTYWLKRQPPIIQVNLIAMELVECHGILALLMPHFIICLTVLISHEELLV